MSDVILKDPDSVLDYTWDWTKWLNAVSDTISSVSWTVPSGITTDSTSNTTLTATIWLSGGTYGETYNITCEIVTAGGRTEDFSKTIQMVYK